MDSDIDEALDLVGGINAAGGSARVLGGIAISMRCASAAPGAPLARTYGDLDLATDKRSVRAVSQVIEAAGYAPAERFNAAHGRSRLLFTNDVGRHLDVFIDNFVMCHALPLTKRLTVDDTTLPLADLLLTKLQIAQLNQKDVIDAAAILADHELGEGDRGINVPYVAELLCNDWGWWRTVTENLGRIVQRAESYGIPSELSHRAAKTGQQLLGEIDQRPKSVKWRMRAKAGDRLPWREDPEDLG